MENILSPADPFTRGDFIDILLSLAFVFALGAVSSLLLTSPHVKC